MNDKIITLGPDYREWPRKYWGTRDRAREEALKAQSARLQSVEPLTPPPTPAVSVSLYGEQGDRERRRREIDRLLVKHGLKERPW